VPDIASTTTCQPYDDVPVPTSDKALSKDTAYGIQHSQRSGQSQAGHMHRTGRVKTNEQSTDCPYSLRQTKTEFYHDISAEPCGIYTYDLREHLQFSDENVYSPPVQKAEFVNWSIDLQPQKMIEFFLRTALHHMRRRSASSIVFGKRSVPEPSGHFASSCC
jgi:hypothetical protein